MAPRVLDYSGKLVLIEAVKEFPILYDRKKNDLSVRKQRRSHWKKVSSKLELPVETCVRNWSNLREHFGRELHKVLKKSNTQAPYKSRWRLYKWMSFVEPFVRFQNRKIQAKHSASIKDKAHRSFPLSHRLQPDQRLDPIVVINQMICSDTSSSDGHQIKESADNEDEDFDEFEGQNSPDVVLLEGPGLLPEERHLLQTASANGIMSEGSRCQPTPDPSEGPGLTPEEMPLLQPSSDGVSCAGSRCQPTPDPSEGPGLIPEEMPLLLPSSDGVSCAVLSSAIDEINTLQKQLSEHQTAIQRHMTARSAKEDAEYHFAMSIACRLRKMSPEGRAIAQSEIIERLLQVEYGAPVSNQDLDL